MKEKIENIILLILSVIAIFLGFLILEDFLDLDISFITDLQFSLILIVLGIIAFVMSLRNLIKNKKASDN